MRVCVLAEVSELVRVRGSVEVWDWRKKWTMHFCGLVKRELYESLMSQHAFQLCLESTHEGVSCNELLT